VRLHNTVGPKSTWNGLPLVLRRYVQIPSTFFRARSVSVLCIPAIARTADCNACSLMIHVATGALRVSLASGDGDGPGGGGASEEKEGEEEEDSEAYCPQCGEYRLLDVTFREGNVPPEALGQTHLRGCIQVGVAAGVE